MQEGGKKKKEKKMMLTLDFCATELLLAQWFSSHARLNYWAKPNN